jgi:DNA-binding beta-propeller fold protein YncE
MFHFSARPTCAVTSAAAKPTAVCNLSLFISSGAGGFPLEGIRAMEADGRVGLRRLGTALACWAAIAVFMLGGVSAEAQTAHAGGTISIGSGFSAPAGVAVDRNGNVFVADDNENVVKEIVAVGVNFFRTSTLPAVASATR